MPVRPGGLFTHIEPGLSLSLPLPLPLPLSFSDDKRLLVPNSLFFFLVGEICGQPRVSLALCLALNGYGECTRQAPTDSGSGLIHITTNSGPNPALISGAVLALIWC